MTDLPPGWAVATLAELVDPDGVFVDGDWVESKDQDPDGEVRLVQLADVGEGEFRDRSNRSLTQSKATELRCTFLAPGDVLIARMPDPLGRACIYPGTGRPAVTVVDVCIIRATTIDHQWLMWALNSPQVRGQILEFQSGTTRKRISRGNLAKVKLFVPPLAEQLRIVASLDEGLAGVARASVAAGRAEVLARHLDKSLLEAVADGSLMPGSSTWPVVSIGEHALVQGGIQKQPKRRPVLNKFPFLRVANVLRGTLNLSEIQETELFEGELERYSLSDGDLLVVEGNGSFEQIGRAARWRGEVVDCVHQNHLIRVRPSTTLDPAFLELVWNSPVVIRQLRQVASSTSGLHTLNTAKIRAIRIPLPPLPLQASLVKEAEQLRSHLEAAVVSAKSAMIRSARLRRRLLSDASAGRLVEQDPNDEPASELLVRIAAKRAAALPKQQARSRRAQEELAAPLTRVTGDNYQQEALPL
ncbi:hypothetical protein [Micromonospora sp. NPDC005324]|uniref:restriction endonuclease subunit S n=1 Tax=Micromonospora sp. NPDC005324 TaxID=3157033 RepID=UPI0033A16204